MPFIKVKKNHKYAYLNMSKLIELWWEYCFIINYVVYTIQLSQCQALTHLIYLFIVTAYIFVLHLNAFNTFKVIF